MFKSIFKNEFNDFVSFKQSLGYDYGKDTINCYKKLDKYFYENNLSEKVITKENYDGWLIKKENECNNYFASKYTAIKQFCSYLMKNNYQNIYFSDEYNIKYKKEFIPYIYTNDEINQMIKLSDEIDYTFGIIIKLLYSTGLRISEALNIKLDNVDLRNNQIYILNSKNNVSRIIVMSDSMTNELKKYINSKIYLDSIYLFSINGKKYNYSRVRRNFHKVLDSLNIKGARLHDLRHTFAVNSLNQMNEKGCDIYTSLPILSKYMGHKGIISTEYYLRFVERYYDDVINQVNNHLGRIYSFGEDNDE